MEIAPTMMDAENGIESAHERDRRRARAKRPDPRDGQRPAESRRPLCRRARAQADRHQSAVERDEVHAGRRSRSEFRCGRTDNGGFGTLRERQRPGHSGACCSTKSSCPSTRSTTATADRQAERDLGCRWSADWPNCTAARAWIDSDAGKGVRAYVYLPGDPHENVKLRRA